MVPARRLVICSRITFSGQNALTCIKKDGALRFKSKFAGRFINEEAFRQDQHKKYCNCGQRSSASNRQASLRSQEREQYRDRKRGGGLAPKKPSKAKCRTHQEP